MMMSKPQLTALRVMQLSQLVLYLVLLLQQLLEPHDHRYSKFQCAAQSAPPPANPVLLPDEVSALQTITNNLELRAQQIIRETVCHDFVSSYGFEVACTCNNQTQQCRISQLRMSNIGLTGVIHEALGSLSDLQNIDLSNNKLHGSIPGSLGNLMKLETLDLSHNQLSGYIPGCLGNLASLRWIYLHYNLLSGVIPQSFGSLLKLEHLYLQFNRIYGTIPDELGKLHNLVYLDLSENQLFGPLPGSLGNLTLLESLLVPANNLSGEFPTTYGNLKSLRLFSVSGNYISGSLPVKTIATWTNLKYLALVGNNFVGNITQEIFDLPMLQELLVSDLTNDVFQLPKNINNSAKFSSVTLRNCSITGPLPKYVGEEMSSIRYLDLGFNKLTGVLPKYMKSKMVYMSFANNNLTGTIPSWIRNGRTKTDLSFNNFLQVDPGVSSNPQLNLFACCRNPSTTALDMMDPSDVRHCPGEKADQDSLFINCGGGETSLLGDKYDQDNETSLFYISPKKNWAYSLTGDFGVAVSNTSDSIQNPTCGMSVPDAPLYGKARMSPVSLKYYAYCMRTGKYKVTLQFAEILYTQDADYTSLRKRAFDVYIQGERRLSWFDIKARGAGKPITLNFSGVDVNGSLLEIHLYWPGKGSLGQTHGPLISAISVTPEFKTKNKGPLKVALITTAAAFGTLLPSVAVAWWMDWLGVTQLEQQIQLDLTVEKGNDTIEQGNDDSKKPTTVKDLVDATGKFDDENKLGKRTYKAELKDKTTVAVKKIDLPLQHSSFLGRWRSPFKTKMEELTKAIETIKSLDHISLLKLRGVHIGKDHLLFVYEYMENGSLANVLFEKRHSRVLDLTWAKRSKICLDIAKGLEYIHNDRRMFHSNIKTSNILLDQDLQPKISDFEFASLCTSEDQVMVITKEVSQGYTAPECFQENVTVTSKADVYSFGVVMLEIVSGRRNMLSDATQETDLLLDKAYKARQEGYLLSLVDSRLSTYDKKEALNILNLAVLCTTLSPLVRPAVSDVVCVLLGLKTIDEVSPPPPNRATSTELSLPSASSPSTQGPHDIEITSADLPAKP